MSHTFTLGDRPQRPNLNLETVPFLAQRQYGKPLAIQGLEGTTLYATDTRIVEGTTKAPFFAAAGMAFNEHLPLEITPDGVWLTLLNGLSSHIDMNAEALRHHFVAHEGKVELTITANAPSLDLATASTWAQGICTFAEKLKDHIGKRHDLIVADFSTTTPTDRLASEISLMGAMKHYFSYKMMFCCGLTRVTVAGTPDDWSKLEAKVRALSEFDLAWWTDALLPVIAQLRATCEGKPDADWWGRMYLTHRYGSGGQYNVTGWINTFYPYVSASKGLARNTALNWETNDPDAGTEAEDFPATLVFAPVILDDNGALYDARFYGGLVGVAVAGDRTVSATSGYAIQRL